MPEQRSRGSPHADVVVIGAGLAGLSAASELSAAGADVVVLEARDRAGGRLVTVELEGVPVDLGGQWIGPTQPRVVALAERCGAKTIQTPDDGLNVEWRGGRRSLYRGPIPTEDAATSAEVVEAIFELERLALAVPADAPWEAQGASELDEKSLGKWLNEQTPSEGARTLLTLAVRAVFGAEPDQLSLLYTLSYLRAAGGLRQLIATTGAAQDRRLVDGTRALVSRLAEPLGDRVVLSSPVREIEQTDSEVEVLADRATVVAQRAIVSLPPPLAASLRYRPDLSPARAQLYERMPMGSTIKVHCLYDEAFWRAEGLSGQVLDERGPVNVALDNAAPDGRGALVGFIVGEAGRHWSGRPTEERRAAVLEGLVRCLGKRAGEPRAYLEQLWDGEEWTGGCPVAYMPPGVLCSVGSTLRTAEGRIHWAGTETATEWTGYMEGALQSGERAAAEVLAALGSEQPLPTAEGTAAR